MMDSSIRLHIPRYKQDFGPAFLRYESKNQANPPPVSEFQAQGVSLSIGKEEYSRYNEGTNQEHLKTEDANITRRKNYVLFQR